MDTFVVTGGAGFIGSNLIRYLLEKTDGLIVVVDKLTYAGHLKNIEDVSEDPRVRFIKADIADRIVIESIFRDVHPTGVFNLAAETHVDRSIDGPAPFIRTNVVGTFEILDVTHRYLQEKEKKVHDRFRFLHVSTDEVYGSLEKEGLFTEETPYTPNSPYSASKAGADHLVRAYHKTYSLPVLITNSSNNFGPYQFPEKLIPLMILNAIEGKPLPIYGDGQQIRDWLYVEDHCEGLLTVLKEGTIGAKYNIGSHNEWTNLDLVGKICDFLEELYPIKENRVFKKKPLKSYKDLISLVKDRPGHDRRYAIDATKIQNELKWRPKSNMDSALKKTIQWYLNNREWAQAIQSGTYNRERLGIKA
ncbi:dTDP-glucose 4,6-dehydratase [bacterium F11]|nr:dTDP-glucose 4,6-dehydratase [bacterium F11]